MLKPESIRKTGPEILRILLMLMIIVHHFIVHGLGLAGLAVGEIRGTPSLVPTELLVNSFVVAAVNSFVLISGYFGIRLKARSLCAFLLQATIYSVGILAVFRGLGWHTGYASIFKYWFLVVYLALMLLSPYLNRLIDSLTNRELVGLVGTFVLIVCGLGFLGRATFSLGTDHGALQMIALYVFGRAMHRFETLLRRIHWKHCLLGISLCGGLVFLSTFALYSKHPSTAWSVFSYENPLILLFSFFLFLVFLRLPWQWTHARKISSHVFGVYLLHDNEQFREMVIQGWIPKIIHQPWEALAFLPLLALALFMAGWLVDVVVLKFVEGLLGLKPLRWMTRNLDGILSTGQN